MKQYKRKRIKVKCDFVDWSYTEYDNYCFTCGVAFSSFDLETCKSLDTSAHEEHERMHYTSNEGFDDSLLPYFHGIRKGKKELKDKLISRISGWGMEIHEKPRLEMLRQFMEIVEQEASESAEGATNRVAALDIPNDAPEKPKEKRANSNKAKPIVSKKLLKRLFG